MGRSGLELCNGWARVVQRSGLELCNGHHLEPAAASLDQRGSGGQPHPPWSLEGTPPYVTPVLGPGGIRTLGDCARLSQLAAVSRGAAWQRDAALGRNVAAYLEDNWCLFFQRCLLLSTHLVLRDGIISCFRFSSWLGIKGKCVSFWMQVSLNQVVYSCLPFSGFTRKLV